MKARDFYRPVRGSAHPYAWLWEPMEADAAFELRSMFSAKAAYLDGRLQFCFMARAEPRRGVLVGTDRAHHEALRGEFPVLEPHGVLSKWLYLPEAADEFERIGQRLVALALRRDPRLGVEGSVRKKPGAKKR